MKVLWISNIEIKEDLKSTGTWIYTMAHAFLTQEGITLGNIVPSKTKQVIRSDFKNINQWKIPFIRNPYKTRLVDTDKKNILDIISVFQPDIIHVWGLENGFGLITPHVNCPVLIEIQGIISEIGRYTYADLTLKEKLGMVRFREIATGDHIFSQRKNMRKMKDRENVICQGNKYFTASTNWMQANVIARTITAKCFSNGFILRDEFYNGKAWEPNSKLVLLTSAAYVAPYKGLHILIDSLAILKVKFPTIQLHIIGPYFTRGIKTNAYITFLLNKIKTLGLSNNVIWLGSLNAKDICTHIHNSSAYVNSSFIESAGMTILEAMALGIPVISTYTGGIPSFNAGSVLYFAPGDANMCAFQISRALTDMTYIQSAGKISRSYIGKFHKKSLVINKQIEIYNKILIEWAGK